MADTTAATQARMERAVVHRNLKLGRITLGELLKEPPECLRTTPTLVIIYMIPYVGVAAIASLNYEAIRRGVNLALPMGALTTRAKKFLTEWEQDRRAK